MGVMHVNNLIPDVSQPIIPGVRGAGFSLGADLHETLAQIGNISWIESNPNLNCKLKNNLKWIGVNSQCRPANSATTTIHSLIFGNYIVSLDFGQTNKLYRILVGKGYTGTFNKTGVGDNLSSLKKQYEIEFNDMDDEFTLSNNSIHVYGISFITNYRISLEHVPDQTIEYISIHDWSLQ